MSVSLLKPGVADVETIGYGEIQDSLTFSVVGAEAVSTVSITEHPDKSANMTFQVTNWDRYHSSWGLGNSVVQLVVETFLFKFSLALLRYVH